jgi:hypothetical protein
MAHTRTVTEDAVSNQRKPFLVHTLDDIADKIEGA